jgi:hypothetical protein
MEILSEPQVISARDKSFILNSIGISLMSVGKPREALQIYERSKELSLSIGDWCHASRVCQNLADLFFYLGELARIPMIAEQAVEMARQGNDKDEEWVSLTYLAWMHTYKVTMN